MITVTCTHPFVWLEFASDPRMYPASPDGFIVLGDLLSHAARTLGNVRIYALGVDEEGNAVAYGELSIGSLMPGQKRPFRLQVEAYDTLDVLYLHAAHAPLVAPTFPRRAITPPAS